MQLNVQNALMQDAKMHSFLRENSQWYKYLNRSSSNYDTFIKAMKKQYRLNPTDKISDAIDNIDLISSVIQTLK